MATTSETRAPVHLWIVGILSLLWNCFGCYDYFMTRTRGADYIATAMPGVDGNAVMAWLDAMPLYAQIGWGLGVWLGLLGSILLLVRSRWAVWSFVISLVGAILSIGYQVALAPPMPGSAETESGMMKLLPYVILLIAAFLAWYARTMEKRGVLR
jgi:hypothetical protein